MRPSRRRPSAGSSRPPVASGAAVVRRPRPRTTRRQTGIGSILAVSLLSAVLAAGGTVLVLGATGALDRGGAFIPTTGQGSNVGTLKPVTIDESSATIDVAAKVSPAVVRITVGGTTPDASGVIPETGVGSGVIYDSNGWILTNHHVVSTSETVQVELKDGRIFTGTVYGIDTLTDLAIVKVDATDLPAAALGDSDALKVGQLVVAIGSPLGTYSNSVTSGIVSAKGRSIETDSENLNNLIQTDAAINPGNSGGPLLDANGAIVGINTAIATNSNGIGFAIPIDIARPIMEQAVAGEPLSRPYLGHQLHQHRPRVRGHREARRDAGRPRRRHRPGRLRRPGRPGRHAGQGRRHRGWRHHRQRRRQGPRRGASARCDPQPVRAGRHRLGRDPARRPDDHRSR